jgi:low affinity Fe/Cu permease
MANRAPAKGSGQSGHSNHSANRSVVHRVNVALERFSHHATAWTGSTWAFSIALGVILIWAVTGPLFHFSDTWQLVINTGTTIVTFLMVFLIQRTQNKDSLAIQVKLDELLASQPGASNTLINLEDWDEDEIVAIHKRFSELAERLKAATDESSAHSIAEAQNALDAAHKTLREVHEARRKTRHSSPARSHH